MIEVHYLDPRRAASRLDSRLHRLLSDVGADIAALYLPNRRHKIDVALAVGVSTRGQEAEWLLRAVSELGTPRPDGSRSCSPLFVASPVLALPVVNRFGKTIGAVGAACMWPRRWSNRDVEALRSLARLSAREEMVRAFLAVREKAARDRAPAVPAS